MSASAVCSTEGCGRSVSSDTSHKCCLVCGIEAAAGTHLAFCRHRHGDPDPDASGEQGTSDGAAGTLPSGR